MLGIKDTPKQLYFRDELAIWNEFKHWGDKNDRHIKIIEGNYNNSEQEVFYSGKILQEIEVNSKGITHILAPLKDVDDISESQLMKISSYYNLVGMRKI